MGRVITGCLSVVATVVLSGCIVAPSSHGGDDGPSAGLRADASERRRLTAGERLESHRSAFPPADLDERLAFTITGRYISSFGDIGPLALLLDDSTFLSEERMQLPERDMLAVLKSGARWLVRRHSGTSLGACEFSSNVLTCDRGIAIQVEEVFSSPPLVDDEAWKSWTYVDELFAMNEPLWMPGDPDVGLESIRAAWKHAASLEEAGAFDALLEHVERLPLIEADQRDWMSMRARAVERGDSALVVALSSRLGMRRPGWGPPDPWLAEYAEACLAAGRLDCFLKLVFQSWGRSFPLVDSPEARLSRAGVDVPKLLLGLVVLFASREDAAVHPAWTAASYDVARFIDDMGLREVLLPRLTSLAERESVDELNRLRALKVLVELNDLAWRQQQNGEGDRSSVWENWLDERHASERASLMARLWALREVESIRLGRLASSWFISEMARWEAEQQELPGRQANERAAAVEAERRMLQIRGVP